MAFTYSRAFSRRSARRAVSAVTVATMLAAQIAPGFLLSTAHAAAIITEVTGGTDISVDNALGGSAPAPTTLGDLVLTEQAM